MRNLGLLFIIIFFNLIFANDCEKKVNEIYKKLTYSIGNNFPFPPDLKIVNDTTNVAYISDKGIVIEKKLINLFCGENNFEDKIAYVLSHELAHHYLSHSWMRNTSLGYASSIGDFIEKMQLVEIKENLLKLRQIYLEAFLVKFQDIMF